MSKEYEVSRDEFKGNPVFQIWEIKKGERSKFPVISFGYEKAKAIVENLEEIKQFIEDNERGIKS